MSPLWRSTAAREGTLSDPRAAGSDDAVAWYDEQAAGLGLEFLDELDRAVRRVASFPLSYPEIDPDIRRCRFARFPYASIYGVDGETIVVVAVAHLHRRPRYWVRR